MYNGVVYQTRGGENVKLPIKYDMVWKERSSDRRYDSYIRHELIIGGISKGVIGTVLY